MKRAEILMRRGVLYVSTMSQTDAGVWLGTEAGATSVDADASTVGALVRAALSRSTVGVPHPSYDAIQDWGRPLLDTAGVRTWSQLMRAAKAIDIEDDSGQIVITPLHNVGPRGGFTETGLDEVRLALPDDEQIGVAVGVAFSRCT